MAEEAEYYNQRATERSYIGEGYNGATKDWAIVDVPPGTRRVELEGIGGAKEEVTWQRYNGVRRSKFKAEEDVYAGGAELIRQEEVVDTRDRGRRFVAQKPKTEAMWTEITKDLVNKEAIEEMGYDYEETEFFFYVMVYLRYVRPPFSYYPPTFSNRQMTSSLTHTSHRRTSSALSKSRKRSNATVATAFAKSNGSAKSVPSGPHERHSLRLPPDPGTRKRFMRGKLFMRGRRRGGDIGRWKTLGWEEHIWCQTYGGWCVV